ncbi:MAG: membrane integrity-associated transporter subunit PqiC [Desulfobacter sp.]|nr:MAG: membrane integrity-associated transporter subunit PqiC [Desulfobacter sp.]
MKSFLARGLGPICLAVCLMGMAGCGGVSPRSSFYRLEGPGSWNETLEAGEDFSVGIGSVALPGYLDRPEIVTGSGENGIRINEFHRWASPLSRQVRESLLGYLSARLHTPRVVLYPWERSRRPRFRVDVTLLRFEYRGNNAIFEALWHIKDVERDRSCLNRKFAHSQAVAGDGVGAYVAAQGRAVELMGDDIAHGLIRAASGGQSPGQ